ncbi:lytic murein transglycosylase [Desulfosediminicola ganghwensis]|uniref:lytic murein transglycosylase n=1 Tax=Desulfosediminicola ganghwensis TaxID=2569540 RepID=UPI0010ABC41C|nr:lytic murein transglycosylase [Desulfosediminicola ganghwensis]
MTRQTKQPMLEKSALSKSTRPPHRLRLLVAVAVACLCLIGGYFFKPLAGHLSAGVSQATENPPESAPGTDDVIINIDTADYRKLFDELANDHGFDRIELASLFSGLTIDQAALNLISDQVESRPYLKYLALLATPAIIQAGKEKLEEHRELLDAIEARYGVDREYLIAIWGIETRFGQRQGKHEVFRVLNTLFSNYPRRSGFFRDELVNFLLLCREYGLSPRSVMGSYAGAFGQPQFIPSSFREYAVSFDDDDKPDIFDSIPDILASIANYLHRHHWVLDAPVIVNIGNELNTDNLKEALEAGRRGRLPRQEIQDAQGVELPPSPDNRPLVVVEFQPNPFFGKTPQYYAGYPNFQAITAWNHSNRYAMIVTHFAQAMTR